MRILLVEDDPMIGEAVSVLETHLYGWGQEVESNAIDFLIHSVRKKLGADAIKNVRGAG